MNPAYISALAALCGSSIGALASFATTWLTQHVQNRTARAAQESTRREKLFGDFIDEASSLYAEALTHDFDEPARLVHLYGVLNKVRLFASQQTIEAADAVLRTIIATFRQPNLDTQHAAKVKGGHLDPLLEFTKACRRELNS